MADRQQTLPDRDDAAVLVCLALGYSRDDGSFQEPDESFCATVYAAVDGDQDTVGEIAAIGRSQRAAEQQLWDFPKPPYCMCCKHGQGEHTCGK